MQDEPLFNLRVAVQQTGLKPDTLRAWERRYGIPTPARSPGGHRLYSRRDIDTVRWLMARQREGLTISNAVELWDQIESEGRDPLEAEAPVTDSPGPALARPDLGGTLTGLREGWMAACLAYDEAQAEQILAQAFALYSPEAVALDLLQSVVAEVGDGWYRGEVTVQQEHFCSAMAIRRLEALVMAAPPPTRAARLLTACPPEENHVISLLLLTFLLRRRGWPVVYLGADVPVERLETTVAVARPRLVILAAQQLHTAATLRAMAHALQQEDVPVAYGGLIFNRLPSIRDRIPGYYLGERLDRAPGAVEALMPAPSPLPAADPVPVDYRQARDHFLERRSLIEAELGRNLDRMRIEPEHLALANRELSRNITAALSLGQVESLGADLGWVEGLLRHRQVPEGMLQAYLEAYAKAARQHLDQRGELIFAWLAAGDDVAGRDKEEV